MNREKKLVVAGIAGGLTLIVTLCLFFGLTGSNDDQNWQIKQTVAGDVSVIDEPGWYYSGFSTVWTYPRSTESYYSKSEEEGGPKDRSIETVFNDGGKAKMSTYIRIQLPTTEDQRRKLHRDFGGNMENVMNAVRSHLNNCVKATGPLMSATEHQSSRKAEFSQLVDSQLREGLYKMRRIEKTLEGSDVAIDPQTGEPITVEKPQVIAATEIVTDDETGTPLIAQVSPLETYGIGVLQFSVTDTEYDPKTEEQFAAKKESYLKAEEAKAQRQNEVQQTLMVIEKGKREVAEIEAEANKAMKKAEVEAEEKALVAEIAKKQAVTEAEQKVEVAAKQKEEAETLKEIAAIAAETAVLEGEALVTLAEAKEKQIELGGAISEKEERLATINAERDAKVAEHLSQVNVPSIVIIGGSDGANGDGGGGQDLQEVLMNLLLLKSTGVMEDGKLSTIGTQPAGN